MWTTRKIKIAVALASLSALFLPIFFWLGLVIAILLGFTWSRLCELRAIKFWLVFLLFAFIPNLFIPTYQMFYLSCLILCRSIIIYLALVIIAANINTEKLNKRLPQILGKRLTITLALAFNLLPIVRNILIRNYALFYFKKTSNISLLKKTCAYALMIFRQIIHAADCSAENMFLSHAAATPKIIIISGAKHSGKTTYAKSLVEKYREKHWVVGGILAPSTMHNDRRNSIYVMDIQTGEKRLLASRETIVEDAIYNYGGFGFSASAYNFAKSALLKYQTGSIIFLDEFGPLEFAKLGYADELQKLLMSDIAALYIIVREELLERFKKEFPELVYDIITITNTNKKLKWAISATTITTTSQQSYVTVMQDIIN